MKQKYCYQLGARSPLRNLEKPGSNAAMFLGREGAVVGTQFLARLSHNPFPKELKMREKLETLALWLGLSLIAIAAVVWVAEEVMASAHQDRICGNGEGRGRGAQVFKGAWSHRVPGLGKERTLEERVAFCRAMGYRPHP